MKIGDALSMQRVRLLALVHHLTNVLVMKATLEMEQIVQVKIYIFCKQSFKTVVFQSTDATNTFHQTLQNYLNSS